MAFRRRYKTERRSWCTVVEQWVVIDVAGRDGASLPGGGGRGRNSNREQRADIRLGCRANL